MVKKQKITKQFGKTQWLIYNQLIPVSVMDKRKYYIKKGGKSVARPINPALSGKTVEVQYVKTGQRVRWQSTAQVYEVLDYDVRRDKG